jgi:AraC family transcriptional regulator
MLFLLDWFRIARIVALHSISGHRREEFLAKIAVTSEARAKPNTRILGAGEGWAVSDVVCSAGPNDIPFEEEHSNMSIAMVIAGSFQYRTSTGRELMTPGSLLLGNAGDAYICGHEHGTGDRCVSFKYSQYLRERLVDDLGLSRKRFHAPRIPPLRSLSPLVAKSLALLSGAGMATYEELAMAVFARAMEADGGREPRPRLADPASLARVTRAVRMIDQDPDGSHDLNSIAHTARLSPCHFLRTFEALTGVTPHQYVLRARLRRASLRLRTERARIIDIALGCGFGDVSNFNRAFRAEFGVSPRAYRAGTLKPASTQ